MRKPLRIFLIILVLVMGIVAMSTVAIAATRYDIVKVSTTWTTVAYDTSGFGCNVRILGRLTSIGQRIDVRMLDKNKYVLWSENDSCPGLASRVYRCGTDVYYIQVRVNAGVNGTAEASKTSDPAD